MAFDECISTALQRASMGTCVHIRYTNGSVQVSVEYNLCHRQWGGVANSAHPLKIKTHSRKYEWGDTNKKKKDKYLILIRKKIYLHLFLIFSFRKSLFYCDSPSIRVKPPVGSGLIAWLQATYCRLELNNINRNPSKQLGSITCF